MARTDIYVYTEATSLTSALITGEANTTAKAFPPVVLGDSEVFSFRFTDGTAYTAWAGDPTYSLELSVRALGSDAAPWVYVAPASATVIANEGWSAALNLNTNELVNAMKAVNISQQNPNFRTYLHIRVTTPAGNVVSYAVAPLVIKYSAYSQVTSPSPTQAQGNILPIAQGGTSAGTEQGARVNILPDLAGNTGLRLAVNATEDDVEWVADGGGTVTNVAIGSESGLTFTGSNTTTNASFVVGGTLAVASGGTGVNTSSGTGSVVLNTSPTIASATLTGTVTSSADIDLTNATASTSTSTGALTVSGGVGVLGALYIGNGIYNSPAAGSSYINSVRGSPAQGQVGLAIVGGSGGTDWLVYQDTGSNDLRFFGNSGTRLTISAANGELIGTSNTASTGPTTGALQLAGGAGIAGAVFAGGKVTSTSATAGMGYSTGAGGTVTQGTSRTTGVELNTVSGAITLVSAAGSTSWQSFTVTNSTVADTDTPVVVQKSGVDLYQIHVTNVSAGSFQISFATTGGTTTEQPVFNFNIIKGVTS